MPQWVRRWGRPPAARAGWLPALYSPGAAASGALTRGGCGALGQCELNVQFSTCRSEAGFSDSRFEGLPLGEASRVGRGKATRHHAVHRPSALQCYAHPRSLIGVRARVFAAPGRQLSVSRRSNLAPLCEGTCRHLTDDIPLTLSEPSPDGWYSFAPAPLILCYAVDGDDDALATFRRNDALLFAQLSPGGSMLCGASVSGRQRPNFRGSHIPSMIPDALRS